MSDFEQHFKQELKKEIVANKEVCIWMSFCDTNKPKADQFLGVIIVKSLGLAHAVGITHSMGVNPGGEMQACEIDSNNIKPEHYNCLLSEDDLKKAGYIG